MLANLKNKIKNFYNEYAIVFPYAFMSIAIITLSYAMLRNAYAEPDDDGGNMHIVLGKGKVVVSAEPGWHVNINYPWSYIVMSDGSKHMMDITSDTVTANNVPPGQVTIKGGICNDSTCKTLKRTVVIP